MISLVLATWYWADSHITFHLFACADVFL